MDLIITLKLLILMLSPPRNQDHSTPRFCSVRGRIQGFTPAKHVLYQWSSSSSFVFFLKCFTNSLRISLNEFWSYLPFLPTPPRPTHTSLLTSGPFLFWNNVCNPNTLGYGATPWNVVNLPEITPWNETGCSSPSVENKGTVTQTNSQQLCCQVLCKVKPDKIPLW